MPLFLLPANTMANAHEKDAAAFEDGQKRLQNGEQPANAQQRTSEILSLLRKMAKK